MGDGLRILLVNDYGVLNGGVEVSLKALTDGLRARGHEVCVFASDAGMREGEASIADEHCLGTVTRLRTLLQSANPWAWSALRRVMRDFRPQVVHLNLVLTQLSPLILRTLWDVPCVYHAQWQRSICPSGTRLLPDGSLCGNKAGMVCYREGCLPLRDWAPLMLQMGMWRRWRKAIDRVVACSEAMRARLAESGIKDIEVIPYGVPERPGRPALEGVPRVAFAGRLVREKGVAVLLEAFERVRRIVPEARLDMYGTGPEERIAAGVRFHGRLAQGELEMRLGSAWVQAVPSVWEEPFGIVAAEAAMRGTAVVASRTGGLREIVVDGETGLLAAPGDAGELAGALGRVVSDRALAERMGAAGRRRAMEHFGHELYVDRWCAFYREIAGCW